MRHTLQAAALLLLFAGGSAAPLAAQAGGSTLATRPQLESRADSLRRVARRTEDQKAASRALREAAAIESRLEQGDFQSGDVVEIRVSEDPDLSGEYSVNQDRMLELPRVDNIDVAGLLYSEAEEHIRESLSVYYRDARIRVRPLRRIAILGAVGSPGFYDLPPATTVSDAIMRAGGPSQRANLDKLQLRRGGERIEPEGKRGEMLQLTLAEIGGTRADQIYVPSEGGGISLGTAATVVGLLSSLIFAGSRIF